MLYDVEYTEGGSEIKTRLWESDLTDEAEVKEEFEAKNPGCTATTVTKCNESEEDDDELDEDDLDDQESGEDDADDFQEDEEEFDLDDDEEFDDDDSEDDE